MANPRACLILLLLPGFMALHATALSFSYDFSKPGDLARANLTYIKDSSKFSDRVSLTEATTWSTGRVAYPQPVRLWDDRTGKRASFTTEFSFAINPVAANSTGVYSSSATNGSTTDDRNERGDGMAFFVGPFPASLPPDSGGGFLGLFSNYSDNPWSPPPPQTVGVEFDTRYNPGLDPPDITADHIGIDINNISSERYSRLPNMTLSGTMSASITYDGGSKVMSVSLVLVRDDGSPRYPYRFQWSQVDLRDAGVPQYAAVGFSAATGDLVEAHQLLSWSFSSKDPSNKTELWVTILIALASASLAGSVAALFCVVIRRQRQACCLPMEIELPVVRKFTFHELTEATKNFTKDGKLGKGAFGEVYRGNLRGPSMPLVAVKRMTMTGPSVLQRTRRDYVTEITTLGQLSHRNLVKLVGWCDGGNSDKLLLVYELVTNKSLDEHLHGPERLLNWPERYKIVLGIGSAIEYLHTGKQKPILHRDIKPSNVMLDDAFEAKLSDFGLVRQVDPDEGSLRGTCMIGSKDYMDPVCITDQSASTASDVYSFGVLLLEIATGKSPAAVRRDLARPNALIETVRESYGGGKVLQMADERLNGNFEVWQIERVLVVGLLCVQPARRDRPGIRGAVNLLSNLGHPVPQLRL